MRVMTAEDWLVGRGNTHAIIVSFSTLIRLAKSLVSCSEGISPVPSSERSSSSSVFKSGGGFETGTSDKSPAGLERGRRSTEARTWLV
jgi:hypothetical protein